MLVIREAERQVQRSSLDAPLQFWEYEKYLLWKFKPPPPEEGRKKFTLTEDPPIPAWVRRTQSSSPWRCEYGSHRAPHRPTASTKPHCQAFRSHHPTPLGLAHSANTLLKLWFPEAPTVRTCWSCLLNQSYFHGKLIKCILVLLEKKTAPHVKTICIYIYKQKHQYIYVYIHKVVCVYIYTQTYTHTQIYIVVSTFM